MRNRGATSCPHSTKQKCAMGVVLARNVPLWTTGRVSNAPQMAQSRALEAHIEAMTLRLLLGQAADWTLFREMAPGLRTSVAGSELMSD